MNFDRQRMERRLAQVAAYRASGQKAKAWAAANGIELGTLVSWCAHAGRWQARLDGVSIERSGKPSLSGFVAACVPAAPIAPSTSVHIELAFGGARLDLHWPLTHARELAVLLKEFGQ